MAKDDSQDKGRLFVSRKIVTHWTWKDPILRGAWVWLIMTAAYSEHTGLKRGQLRFSITQGPKVFGMTISQTRRFLEKLSTPGPWNKNDPEIIWERGAPGGQWARRRREVRFGNSNEHSSRKSGNSGGRSPGIITLCNYQHYNPTGECLGNSNEHSSRKSGNSNEHLLEPKVQEPKVPGSKVEYYGANPAQEPGVGRSIDAIEASKKRAEEALDALVLDKFRKKYPHLNIDEELEACKNHHLSIQANYHGKKRYTDWNRVLHTWCNQPWKKPKETGSKRNYITETKLD